MPTALFLCLRKPSNQKSWLAHSTLTCAQNPYWGLYPDFAPRLTSVSLHLFTETHHDQTCTPQPCSVHTTLAQILLVQFSHEFCANFPIFMRNFLGRGEGDSLCLLSLSLTITLILHSTVYHFSLIILFHFYSHTYSLTINNLWHWMAGNVLMCH